MNQVIVVDKKALLAQPELKLQLTVMARQICEVDETYQFLSSGEYNGALPRPSKRTVCPIMYCCLRSSRCSDVGRGDARSVIAEPLLVKMPATATFMAAALPA